MSLSLRSLIEVMPIGWSGSCSLMRSELMSIPHACAKGISFSASVTGMRHTLLILSHRAVVKLSFSDWISSLSYGVSSIMCWLSKYTFFMLAILLFLWVVVFLRFVQRELFACDYLLVSSYLDVLCTLRLVRIRMALWCLRIC